MTNKRSTKHALLMSALALLLCVSMLIGSTYAWFTDSVTSTGNIIKSGTLDVTMEWKDATENGAYKNADDGAPIFNYDMWEPGYVEAKNIKITNVGTLALKYQLNILAETAVSELADVIDVYYADGEKALANRDLTAQGLTRLGTLTEVLAGISTTASGNLKAGENHTVTLALKMQESADNKYQDKSIGSTFTVQLLATQLMSENDSFGNDYDADALVCDVLATPDTFFEILANAEAGTVIGMVPGEYVGKITIPQNNITLVSNSAIVDSVDLNGKDGVTLDGLTFYAIYDQIETSNYVQGSASYKPSGYVASITNTISTPYGADNVVIKNCKFQTFPEVIADPGNFSSLYTPETYCAIDFEDQGRVSGPSANITIESCVFETPAFNHIRLNYVDGDVVIKNNKFVAPTSHHNINASGNKANWTITGNAFSNWADGEYAFGTSRDGGAEVLTLKITNNTFIKSLAKDAEIPVLSIKSSYTAANSVVVVENNVANNGNATIDAAIRSDSKYYMTGNSGFATVSSESDIKNALANGADTVDAGGANIGEFEYGLTTSLVPAGKTVTISNAVIDGWNYGNAVAGTVVFENCTFTSNSAYSIHFDAGNGNVVFNNCVLEGWCSFGSAIKSVTFNDCTIRGNGIYALVRCYQDFTMENCVIDASNTDTTDVYQDGIDVIAGYTATMINCTNVNGSVADLFEADDIAGTNGNVIIN